MGGSRGRRCGVSCVSKPTKRRPQLNSPKDGPRPEADRKPTGSRPEADPTPAEEGESSAAARNETPARWRRSPFARRRIDFSEESIDRPVLAVRPRVIGPRPYEYYEGEEPEDYDGDADDDGAEDDDIQYDPDVSF